MNYLFHLSNDKSHGDFACHLVDESAVSMRHARHLSQSSLCPSTSWSQSQSHPFCCRSLHTRSSLSAASHRMGSAWRVVSITRNIAASCSACAASQLQTHPSSHCTCPQSGHSRVRTNPC